MSRETVRFDNCRKSLFAAWYSDWNANTYLRREPFREQPCLMNAGSTAGAPVALGDGFLVGLLKECDAVFEWDGVCLRVDAPGDALFVSTAADESQRWKEYHQALGIEFRRAPFGLMPEYCTWVEQVRNSPGRRADDAMERLTGEFVLSYLEEVKQSGWPAGRFTVDAGWSLTCGEGGFGDWDARPGMEMPALAEAIQREGHVPGLWMAPSLVHPQSRFAREFPEAVGSRLDMGGECVWSRFCELQPSAASQGLIDNLFRRAFEWGFRKFKLDILYGPKPEMYELSRQCRLAADRLPEPVELEGHIPDPFCARHMDVIRLNDVLISSRHPNWKAVYEGHLEVCRRSVPGMVLNLDHVGGNCVDVGEALFIEHVELLKKELVIGYPAVSLLPGHVGERAVEVTDALLNATQDQKAGKQFLRVK